MSTNDDQTAMCGSAHELTQLERELFIVSKLSKLTAEAVNISNDDALLQNYRERYRLQRELLLYSESCYASSTYVSTTRNVQYKSGVSVNTKLNHCLGQLWHTIVG